MTSLTLTEPLPIGNENPELVGLFPAAEVSALQDIGRLFYARGWSVGTCSNYSIVLSKNPLRILITASGKDKRQLSNTDFVIVDETGKPIDPRMPKPSAETMLHVVAAQKPGVGAVLHTHSIWGTLLSDIHGDAHGLWISGYEMLKGLAGVTTHEHREWLEIFPNTQDIDDLADRVQAKWDQPTQSLRHGFLLRNHGLYTWGADLAEARRHIEIWEFLFEVLVHHRGLFAC